MLDSTQTDKETLLLYRLAFSILDGEIAALRIQTKVLWQEAAKCDSADRRAKLLERHRELQEKCWTIERCLAVIRG